ncbi:MAG: hypothetical protein MJZ75_06770 [Paludibacteraceae bacterium]|nr:hypothetical protein [Paludibacteraceae bacterium]
MKKTLLTLLASMFIGLLSAQITIMDGDVQEKIVSKPQVFDSLQGMRLQKDPVQYKQYIGYKLYCRSLSNKFKCKYSDCTFYLQNFKYKTSHEQIKEHIPFAQTDVALIFGDIKKLKGSALAQYKERELAYENSFKVSTDIYNAAYNAKVPDQSKYYTPYESIQNTYFTILDIEIGDRLNKGKFTALEDWDNPYNLSPDNCVLRFTLKNETTNEEIYWIANTSDIENSVLFLVPYFEKMQKQYKGKNVVPTTEILNLVDVNTGAVVDIRPNDTLPKEVWKCYDVTFVHLKDQQLIEPFFFLEKDGSKIKINFKDFTKECNGIFTREDRIYRPAFMLESEYDEIVAEKQRAIEEQLRLKEEQQKREELARQERNRIIIQKYGEKLGSLICAEKVILGMNREMCRAAWGEPLSINSTYVEGAVFEQWVYGWKTYLYFDNGILKVIQN